MSAEVGMRQTHIVVAKLVLPGFLRVSCTTNLLVTQTILMCELSIAPTLGTLNSWSGLNI